MERWTIHLYSNTPPHVEASSDLRRGIGASNNYFYLIVLIRIRTRDLWLWYHIELHAPTSSTQKLKLMWRGGQFTYISTNIVHNVFLLLIWRCNGVWRHMLEIFRSCLMVSNTDRHQSCCRWRLQIIIFRLHLIHSIPSVPACNASETVQTSKTQKQHCCCMWLKWWYGKRKIKKGCPSILSDDFQV